MGTNATSLQAAQANTRASAEIWAQRLNDNLLFTFHADVNNASISRQNGRDVGVPAPPVSWVPAENTDGTWTVAQTGPPVCPMPVLPEVAKPYVPTPVPGPSNIVQAPKDDTLPVGYIFTDATGKKWQKGSSPTPFGMAYFYQVVA